MSKHKISSKVKKKESTLMIELFNTPKTILDMRNANKEMFMVMFKVYYC